MQRKPQQNGTTYLSVPINDQVPGVAGNPFELSPTLCLLANAIGKDATPTSTALITTVNELDSPLNSAGKCGKVSPVTSWPRGNFLCHFFIRE